MGHESSDLSYFLGGLALMSTAISLALFSRSYLPGSQMKILDELLQETRQIYDKSMAEDLLPGGLKADLGEKLIYLERSREQFREQAYQAITIFDQYIALFRGLSMRIIKVSKTTKDLRARVVTTSEQTKRRREEGTRFAGLVIVSEVLPPTCSTENQPVTDSPAQTLEAAPEDRGYISERRSTTPESHVSTLVEQQTPSIPAKEKSWYLPLSWRLFPFTRTKCPTCDIESNSSQA